MTNNNLIFRDKDTNSALEKVAEKLGPNAYILEINNVGNFVEITASLEPPKAKVKSDNDPNFLLKEAKRELEHFVLSKSLTSKDVTSDDLIGNEERDETLSRQEKNLFLGSDEPSASIKDTTNVGYSTGTEDQSTHNLSQEKNLKSKAKNSLIEDTDTSLKHRDNSKIEKEKLSKQGNFSYGDLINLGFCKKFIKKELGIREFEGSVSREKLIDELLNSLIDSHAEHFLQTNITIVLLGAPGSGKSTLLGKFMHQRGSQNSLKPEILHFTCEKLFEADRLRFYSKLLNFNFKRHNSVTKEFFKMRSDLVEVDWSQCTNFTKFYRECEREVPYIKPILTVSGETSFGTLKEILKVSAGINRVIITKCDYGRFSVKNLMQLYENRIKISAVSGDRNINDLVKFTDTNMVAGFCEYCVFA